MIIIIIIHSKTGSNAISVDYTMLSNDMAAKKNGELPYQAEYNMTRLELRNPMQFARLYSFFKNFASLRENIKQYYYFRDLTIQ